MGSPKMNYVLRPTRVMSRGGRKSQVRSVLLAWEEMIALRVNEEEDVMYAAAV